MTATTREDFYKAARELNRRYSCNVPFNNSNLTIDLGTPAANRLEGVCHELAHALLLGLPIKRLLAREVSNALRRLPTWETYDNEAEAIAVTTGVLRKLRIPFHRDTFLNEAHSKVNSPLERMLGFSNRFYDVEFVWRRFFRTKRYREAVSAIVEIFEKEVIRGKEEK